jgi:hypothetical protein
MFKTIYCTHATLFNAKTLHFSHTVYVCVSYAPLLAKCGVCERPDGANLVTTVPQQITVSAQFIGDILHITSRCGNRSAGLQ